MVSSSTGRSSDRPAVAQASRSPRQVQLRRFLQGCEVVAFHPAQAQAVGALLARAGTADVVNAHLLLTAKAGDVVVTSDPDDLRTLAAHLRPRITIRTTT